MLDVKLTFSLLGCPSSSSSFCKHKFSIYVLHVEKELVGVDLNPLADKVTHQKVETIAPTDLPAPGKPKEYDYDGKIITKKGGLYLAFLDQGACVSLSNFIVSYNYCSEIGRVLVRFSRIAAPINDSYLEEQTGRCTDVNSINKVKLSGVCLSNGEWNITDGIKCLCKPSYELANGSEGNVLECSGMHGIYLFLRMAVELFLLLFFKIHYIQFKHTNRLVIGCTLINVTAMIYTQTTKNCKSSFGFHSCINRVVEVLATVCLFVLFC